MYAYEESHPWITFTLPDLTSKWRIWLRLGEADSKCQHLAGVPVKPSVAEELMVFYMAKGARATTAIEGNTLTEEQVRAIADNTARIPASQEYQEVEVRNVIGLMSEISKTVVNGGQLPLTPSRMMDINERLLEGTDLSDGVTPGVLRHGEVIVGSVYRGAPPQDCEYLLDRLCIWLDSDDFRSDDSELQFALAVIKAIVAHVYLAWIHPFDDGNGRTARLVEHQILAMSGLVPLPATSLLSGHYNLTRGRYYRLLEEASRKPPIGDLSNFIEYAALGLADGLRGQIERLKAQQVDVAWSDLVREIMAKQPTTDTSRRREEVAMALDRMSPTPSNQVPLLTPSIARMYAPKGDRTVVRDLNALRTLRLARKVPGGWVSNKDMVLAFRPPVYAAPEG
jgi:Fic family protein